MSDKTTFSAKLLILISLLQGLALLLLHQAIDFKFWPHGSPQWLFSFYSMAFVGPIMLLLGLKTQQEMAVAKWVLPFTLIVGLLGYYVGYQTIPMAHIRYENILFAFVATMVIATFKALMYVQQFISGEGFSYSHLFRWSWRNFLTLGLSLLFTACFWGVLMLWAGLFKAIDIDFFYELFTEKWFFYPALALANGFGIIIFRNLSHIIDTITRLQQALMKFLLVLLVLVSICFLGALPVSGLAPLWESGGSSLILWMQALMLFFINAVYQDDSNTRPYHLWLHRFIYLGVALLPIYSAISFYGLSLRIDQYGWSVSRCWAMLIWLLLALFSVGYLWGIIKRRDNWLGQLSKVNVTMGLILLVCMLLVSSPMVDFRKITVASQLHRLETKQVDVDDLDIHYFRRHLARPGYLALETLKASYAETNPQLVVRINSLYSGRNSDDITVTKEEFLAAVKVISGTMPDTLGTTIYQSVIDNSWRIQQTKQYYLLPIDLNNDGQQDYLFFEEMESNGYLYLYYYENAQWLQASLGRIGSYVEFNETFINALKTGRVETLAPQWLELQIGDQRFQVE